MNFVLLFKSTGITEQEQLGFNSSTEQYGQHVHARADPTGFPQQGRTLLQNRRQDCRGKA